MNKFLFFLSCCIAVVVSKADPQYPPYNYYPANLYPNNYPYIDYPLEPSPYLISSPNNRLFFNLWTVTTTSTSTTTCTVSTNVNCAGRRRRFMEFLDSEDETIDPTSVDKVEVTEAAKLDQFVRKDREANPQYFRDLYFPGTFQLPQPTFGSRYYPSYPKMYNRQIVGPVDPENSRLFWVSTSTVTTVSTARSTPVCSAASTFSAC